MLTCLRALRAFRHFRMLAAKPLRARLIWGSRVIGRTLHEISIHGSRHSSNRFWTPGLRLKSTGEANSDWSKIRLSGGRNSRSRCWVRVASCYLIHGSDNGMLFWTEASTGCSHKTTSRFLLILNACFWVTRSGKPKLLNFSAAVSCFADDSRPEV